MKRSPTELLTLLSFVTMMVDKEEGGLENLGAAVMLYFFTRHPNRLDAVREIKSFGALLTEASGPAAFRAGELESLRELIRTLRGAA